MPSDRRWSDADRELAIVAAAQAINADDTYGDLLPIAYIPEIARIATDAALHAVAPLIAARVRAEELARVVEQVETTLAKLREHMLIGLQDADLEGDGGTKRINEWADHVDNQIRAAIARAHRATPEADHA